MPKNSNEQAARDQRAFKYSNTLHEFLIMQDDVVYKTEIHTLTPPTDIEFIKAGAASLKDQSPEVSGTLDK